MAVLEQVGIRPPMCRPYRVAVEGDGEDVRQGPCHDERDAELGDDIEVVAPARDEDATIEEDDAELDEAVCGRHEQLRDELHFLHQRDLRVPPREDESRICIGRRRCRISYGSAFDACNTLKRV